MKIRMLRNVLVEGEHCAVGELVEVEEGLGEMLVRMGRAEEAEGEGEKGRKGEGEQEVETATRPGGKRRGK